MFRVIGVVVIFTLILSGCGNRETDAERRQREAVDLCYKGIDCLKAEKKDGEEKVEEKVPGTVSEHGTRTGLKYKV